VRLANVYCKAIYSTTFALFALLGLTIIWLILDLTLLDYAFRFVLTPYLGKRTTPILCQKDTPFAVVVFASSGVLSEQSDHANIPDDTVTFTWIVLAIGAIAFVVKVGGVIYYQIKKPLGI